MPNEFSQLSCAELEKKLFTTKISFSQLQILRQDARKNVQTLLRRYDRWQKEQARLLNLFTYEQKFYEQGLTLVAGTDEVGRGPLAGPVTAAAVILPPKCLLPKLNDSKKLSAKIRNNLYAEITAQAISYAIVHISPAEIDSLNIYKATEKAMYTAINQLHPTPEAIISDAMPLRELTLPVLPLIKGDTKSANIAAASILAKVSRDKLMDDYDLKYPHYGFAHNKGYGTAEHLAALQKYGITPIHRRSFSPIKELL